MPCWAAARNALWACAIEFRIGGVRLGGLLLGALVCREHGGIRRDAGAAGCGPAAAGQRRRRGLERRHRRASRRRRHACGGSGRAVVTGFASASSSDLRVDTDCRSWIRRSRSPASAVERRAGWACRRTPSTVRRGACRARPRRARPSPSSNADRPAAPLRVERDGPVVAAVEDAADQPGQDRRRADLDERARAAAYIDSIISTNRTGRDELARQLGTHRVDVVARVGRRGLVGVDRHVGRRERDVVEERGERIARSADDRRVERGGDRQPLGGDPALRAARPRSCSIAVGRARQHDLAWGCCGWRRPRRRPTARRCHGPRRSIR